MIEYLDTKTLLSYHYS